MEPAMNILLKNFFDDIIKVFMAEKHWIKIINDLLNDGDIIFLIII
jgi:hypothetical protein